MPVNTSAIQIEFNQPPPELTRNSSKCTFEFRAEILSLSRKSLYYCRLSLFSPCSTVYISISCPYIPLEFLSEEEYYSYVYRLGNVTLIESMINQAVNNYNDLSTDQWFYDKQSEYGKSSVCLTKLLDSKFYIGVNTALNRFKNDFQYNFTGWNKSSVEARQKILLELVFDTWRINDLRLDRVK